MDDDDDEADENVPWNVYDVSSQFFGERGPKINARYPCLARFEGDITRRTFLLRQENPGDNFSMPDIGKRYTLPTPPPEAFRAESPKVLNPEDMKVLGAEIGRRWGKTCATFTDPASGRKVHFIWDKRSFALVDLVDAVQSLAAYIRDRLRKRT
jgi:hypothetical protein